MIHFPAFPETFELARRLYNTAKTTCGKRKPMADVASDVSYVSCLACIDARITVLYAHVGSMDAYLSYQETRSTHARAREIRAALLNDVAQWERRAAILRGT